jgi:plasmid maintenance system antidote protein VapI
MAKPKPRQPGDLLRSALEKRGWLQADLAKALGVPSGTVNNWCVGRRRPNVTFSLEIQEILGLPPSTWAKPRVRAEAA